MQKAQRICCTIEEDIHEIDFKYRGEGCERKFPYSSSVATHRRLHCKPPTPNAISTLLYGCESWKLTESVRRRLNSTASKMLLKTTGRSIADKARQLSPDVSMCARDQRGTILGTYLEWKSTALHYESCFNVSNQLQNHCLVMYKI